MIRKKMLRLLATTIPAGTLRLLLTSISYRAKARKEKRRQAASSSARRAHAAGLPRRVDGVRVTRRKTANRRVGAVCDVLPRLA